MIHNRTPIKPHQVIRYPKKPWFNPAMMNDYALASLPLEHGEYQFVPRVAVAAECMQCSYQTGRTILLYTQEEVAEHAEMHELMRTK